MYRPKGKGKKEDQDLGNVYSYDSEGNRVLDPVKAVKHGNALYALFVALPLPIIIMLLTGVGSSQRLELVKFIKKQFFPFVGKVGPSNAFETLLVNLANRFVGNKEKFINPDQDIILSTENINIALESYWKALEASQVKVNTDLSSDASFYSSQIIWAVPKTGIEKLALIIDNVPKNAHLVWKLGQVLKRFIPETPVIPVANLYASTEMDMSSDLGTFDSKMIIYSEFASILSKVKSSLGYSDYLTVKAGTETLVNGSESGEPGLVEIFSKSLDHWKALIDHIVSSLNLGINNPKDVKELESVITEFSNRYKQFINADAANKRIETLLKSVLVDTSTAKLPHDRLEENIGLFRKYSILLSGKNLKILQDRLAKEKIDLSPDLGIDSKGLTTLVNTLDARITGLVENLKICKAANVKLIEEKLELQKINTELLAKIETLEKAQAETARVIEASNEELDLVLKDPKNPNWALAQSIRDCQTTYSDLGKLQQKYGITVDNAYAIFGSLKLMVNNNSEPVDTEALDLVETGFEAKFRDMKKVHDLGYTLANLGIMKDSLSNDPKKIVDFISMSKVVEQYIYEAEIFSVFLKKFKNDQDIEWPVGYDEYMEVLDKKDKEDFEFAVSAMRDWRAGMAIAPEGTVALFPLLEDAIPKRLLLDTLVAIKNSQPIPEDVNVYVNGYAGQSTDLLAILNMVKSYVKNNSDMKIYEDLFRKFQEYSINPTPELDAQLEKYSWFKNYLESDRLKCRQELERVELILEKNNMTLGQFIRYYGGSATRELNLNSDPIANPGSKKKRTSSGTPISPDANLLNTDPETFRVPDK